jgi:hypothetical protein
MANARINPDTIRISTDTVRRVAAFSELQEVTVSSHGRRCYASLTAVAITRHDTRDFSSFRWSLTAGSVFDCLGEGMRGLRDLTNVEFHLGRSLVQRLENAGGV